MTATTPDDKMNIEATQFAFELLMPSDLLMKDIRRVGGIDPETDPNIKVLAKKYKVSEQLMALRIGQLLFR